MSHFRLASLVVALLIFGAALGPCHAALLFTFSYSLPPWDPSTDPLITASGTITTEDTPTNGGYRLTSISGSRTLSFGAPGVPQPFGALLAPGSIGNSNLVFPASPHLDFGGWGFMVGAEAVNLYFADPDGYTENRLDIGFGTLSIDLVATPTAVPEPASALICASGLILTAARLRRRRSQP